MNRIYFLSVIFFFIIIFINIKNIESFKESNNNTEYQRAGIGDCPGGDLGGSTTPYAQTGVSLEQCFKICNESDTCRGVSYNASERRCAPKNNVCTNNNYLNGYIKYNKSVDLSGITQQNAQNCVNNISKGINPDSDKFFEYNPEYSKLELQRNRGNIIPCANILVTGNNSSIGYKIIETQNRIDKYKKKIKNLENIRKNEPNNSIKYKNFGNKYCKSYDKYNRFPKTSVDKCKEKCTNDINCNAIAVGPTCVTYKNCVISSRKQSWGYNYYQKNHCLDSICYNITKAPRETVGKHLKGSGKQAWPGSVEKALKIAYEFYGLKPGSTLRYIQNSSGRAYFYAGGNVSGKAGSENWRIDPI